MVGLNWAAVEGRLADADAETRARVMDLIAAVEAGALAADAARRIASESEG